ncbi:multidrug effflux MFS transporter [Rhodoplanes sp. TEM]|uniref:Bcr/CflA family efflux transporter n=1 Tax=Rhodoplanes tepidamans TaxID=200616 RepID=A0ABT5J908_RHOTP|nr:MULTISPECIES: multidrug effflux MFS transporter [Rhodoplanes]MDC7786144.1 multidrug effflux MFS transporter [Rhodoplanes tepidamans]MDC7982811.1 multidrug effflux MFS transporter [Rhodoplanes sp. TEM]MDQ0357191.1 DHA1 family bicyclomycin/chloramphenicol resistance-like MFS transporter [Rhodoplanes tepidamans]
MLDKSSLAFTVLLSSLVALPPLSIDLGLPAFAATAADLGTGEPAVALTLSWFMLGFAAGPLVYGPVSDRFGRKPVMLAGLSLYALTSVLCAAAPTIGVLLAARLFQGLAAAAGTVLVIAAIRDLFDGIAARKKISWVMAINAIMPLTAPTIGVYTLAFGGWRAGYALMAVFGAALLAAVTLGFRESIVQRNRDALAPRQLVAGYREVLTHPVSLKASLLNAACFGVLFAYISGSSIVFIGFMGLSAAAYGYVFAVPVTGAIGGTLLNGALLGRGVAPVTLVRAGLALMTGAATLLVVALAGPLAGRLVPIVALLFVSAFSVGLVGPNVSYAAMRDLPHRAGVASAVLTSAQMVVGALSSAIVAALFDTLGASAMAAVMVGFAAVAVGLHLATPAPPPPAPPAGPAPAERPGEA